MSDTDRNSIALPGTATDPDARVRDAFDAATAEAEQIVIVPFASNKENEGRIRREVVAILRRLAGALGVEDEHA